jgi:hypothetical protein
MLFQAELASAVGDQCPYFFKAPLIQQHVYALTGGKFPLLVLGGDAVLSASQQGLVSFALELITRPLF